MKKTVLALAIALPALAFAADPPNADAPKQTEINPQSDQPSMGHNDDLDAKTTPPMEASSPTSKTRTTLTDKDTECLAKLHHDNQMETKMGELAKKNGQSKQVKQFGEMLIKDHGLADKQVSALAKKKNIDLTMPPPKDESERAERQSKMDSMNKLETLKGDEFDREFARMMVEDHQKAIDLVTTTEKQTQDSKIQSLLNKLLPVLKEHHRVAQQIAKRVESV